ncbi:unnamed protein product [Adineta ricciae]|uniref:Uncharacterized protein n=1 Tax=Adineta ricciae TaxID=249248 RepID=A0A813WDF2_ADIRI|nr:unnamed protein product [Adineta ricciae]CAF1063050.1 unnamed protein product [Adineta ricciae]
MRKLSLDRVYGCSTAHRHSIVALPENRVAFLAGCYLVILDCLTNERRYLTFSAIKFLATSPSAHLMSIIDQIDEDSNSRIHIYSTKPIDLLLTIEPDRFGSFIGLSIDTNDSLLMILHSEPAYMITIQEIYHNDDESKRMTMVDLASVRVVHGPVVNRMNKKEIIPHVAFISFCSFSSKVFCATGLALFKLYELDQEIIHQRIIHFRAEFYAFTCHCWLAINSILVRSIRFEYLEINSTELSKNDHALSVDLESPLTNEEEKEALTETKLYLDLFAAREMSPNVIVSFREHLFVFAPIMTEPFFQVTTRYCLEKSSEHHTNMDKHQIHKMSYVFDNHSSMIYVLTDRNQIFRYTIHQTENKTELEEQHIYSFHAYRIRSIALCMHKPWLITLGDDNWIRVIDYEDNNREVVSKYLPDGAQAITGSDPYGFHLCLAMSNHFQLYLITNYELRMIHQYETRNVREVEMSQSGHLIAVVTNNLIKIYSTIHFNLISQLRGHVGKIKQIVWCKYDSILISCSTDGMIYIFNIYTGMREGEIITKQFRYVGIAVTHDCNRIYGITSDSSIKLFNNTHLEQECSIENNFIPSAICLSKSERLLFVGMTNGTIRIFTTPLTANTYMDLPAHCSTIRRFLVSSNDEYLISIAESAYVLLFKQTLNTLSSVSNQFSELLLENLDVINQSKRVRTTFEYILVTKSEFDEQQQKIKEIQERINEFDTENNLKLRTKQIAFSNELTAHSTQFQTAMKQLLDEYQQLKLDISNEHAEFAKRKNDIDEKYDILQTHSEVIYENQMIDLLTRINNAQEELTKLQTIYENKDSSSKDQEHTDLNEIINQVNLKLQSKWRTAVHNHEQIQEQERQMNEYIRQIEIDIDDEIESIKINSERELKSLTNHIKRLTINVSALRKRYNSIVERMGTRDTERSNIEKEVKELQNRKFELIEKLEHFRSIIKKKEDRIGIYDIKIHRLQQHILHVEKRKYVLDYKTKSLLERIEPMDQEIARLKTNNQNLEQQLTILKQQQNDLIVKQKNYEFKLERSTKQLNLAKISYQNIWKTVKQRKDALKKAFEYTEISCTSETTIHSKEQLKAFIQNMCHSIQNEQQTENQLEIQDSIKEWNNQRNWLLHHLHNLTTHTENNKQTFANVQREHRKAIVPFINQLRQLHNLHDDIQKKIQKHFALLKIKASEQNDFLQSISSILHVNENLHLTIDQLSQKELHIEIQDKEIDRLAAITFRSQYAAPCLESNQSNEKAVILPTVSTGLSTK